MNIQQRIASIFSPVLPSPEFFARLSFRKASDWNDIVQKAQMYLRDGRVHVLVNTPKYTAGVVKGLTGTYRPEFSREDPNAPNALTQSHCTCPWETYRWQRTRQWKKLEGRLCVHLLSLYWKSLSTPMDTEGEDNYQFAPGQKQGPVTPTETPEWAQEETPSQTTFEPMENQKQLPVPQQPAMKDMAIAPQPENPVQPARPKRNIPQRQPLDITQQGLLFDDQGNPVQPAQNAFSVPDGTPQRPDNIWLPGTYSSIPVRIIEGGWLDFGDGQDEFTQWVQAKQAAGETPVVQLTQDVQLELRGSKIPAPDAQPIGMTDEGIEQYRWQDLGWDPETQQRVNANDRPNGAPEWRGQYATMRAGKRATVRATEPYTRMVEIMVPLNDSGKLHAHLATGWVAYDDVAPLSGYSGLSDPFRPSV